MVAGQLGALEGMMGNDRACSSEEVRWCRGWTLLTYCKLVLPTDLGPAGAKRRRLYSTSNFKDLRESTTTSRKSKGLGIAGGPQILFRGGNSRRGRQDQGRGDWRGQRDHRFLVHGLAELGPGCRGRSRHVASPWAKREGHACNIPTTTNGFDDIRPVQRSCGNFTEVSFGICGIIVQRRTHTPFLSQVPRP